MTIPARRDELRDIRLNGKAMPHTGLWLDKFLPMQFSQGERLETNLYTEHFRTATGIPISPIYRVFYERWKATLAAVGARTAVATTQGRLVVGLGADSVLENAITLHRTYGVPYIPGSALKGLAAYYAHNRLDHPDWQKGDKAHKILFGDTASAGYVTFFDALYIPGSAPNDKPLVLDAVTVHHPEYYRGENKPPTDWDGPNPVPFVSARGKFLVALVGPDEWIKAAFQILALALDEDGIGAKTSSGYGRMELEILEEEEEEGALSSPTPEYREVERFRQWLASMAVKDVAGQIHGVYQAWKSLEASTEVKRVIAQAILDKIEEAKRTKKTSKKAWYQELVIFVKNTSTDEK